jgi:hypothetical protein
MYEIPIPDHQRKNAPSKNFLGAFFIRKFYVDEGYQAAKNEGNSK